MNYEVIFTESKSRSVLFPKPFRTKAAAVDALKEHAKKNETHARGLSVRGVKQSKVK